MNIHKQRLYYWIALGLFSALFIYSALLTAIDAQGSYEEFLRLGFPAWLTYPTAIAKILGVVAILKSKSRSLKDFAYAGFLYDLLLALGAHISKGDAFVFAPIVGLGLWAFAYVMDRRMGRQVVAIVDKHGFHPAAPTP